MKSAHQNLSSKLVIVGIQQATIKNHTPLPFFTTHIPAGFPSPAENHMGGELDLNELVVKHPAATFFVRVEGDSMRDAGIHSGDILVVDRSIEPSNNKIVIAVIDGEFTVKRIVIDSKGVSLVPANRSYSSFQVKPESDFRVWGVVTYVIHRAQ